MKVYIAGKITGLDEALVFKKFNESKLQLRKQGCVVMSPAVLASNEGFAHSNYMHICFAMIDVCDAVYMQKDWQDSKGARTRKSNINERKTLEALDRKPSEDEIAQAFLTLTSAERQNLALLGMTAILEDTQSLKGFYEFLSGWKK